MSTADILELGGYIFAAYVSGFTSGWLWTSFRRAVDAVS